jgi:hypothetical protein
VAELTRPVRVAASLLALAAGLATACGTTVPQSALQTANGAAGSSDELSVSSQSSAAGSVGVTGGPGTATGQVPGQQLSPQSSAAEPGTTASTATGPGAITTQGSAGAPSTPVRVGLLYIDGADSMAQSFGISNLSTGDPVAQTRAIARYLNKHGALAGRQIHLYYGRMTEAQIVNDPNSAHAAACASLAQDDKVSYVVSYVQLTAGQLECYTQRGVTVIDDQSSVPDSAGAQNARAFASPGELALGRAANELVDSLWKQGWLTSTSKVGTFVYDTPDGVELETKYLVPALARHGIKPVATARASDSANGANQDGTVLQFRSKGVDRVIPLGASPLFLMEAAESQHYRPAYAVTSTWGPGALIESTAPKNQLRNAAGIGWNKLLDIGGGKMPGPVSPNETLCFQIMKSGGQGSSKRTVQAFQTALCNELMFLQTSAQRYGLGPNMLTLARQSNMSVAPADAFAERLVPGRADGVAAYRNIVFQSGCQCFQYTSGDLSTR